MTPSPKDTDTELNGQVARATFRDFVQEQVRQAIRATFIDILEEEVSQFIGAGRYERRPGRGNARLRTALYMAALSARRFNPLLKALYTRLREAGKPAKVAQCAVARKLVRIAWAVVIKEQDFDPQYAAPQETRQAA